MDWVSYFVAGCGIEGLDGMGWEFGMECWLMLDDCSDTLLRHLEKIHDAGDAELPAPDLDASMEINAETPIESRGAGTNEAVIEPSLLVGGSNITSADSNYQTIGDEMAIQNSAAPKDTWPQSILEQSWWLDYGFDPGSLNMSSFELMAFLELFSRNNAAFYDSQLPPYDRTLPGLEIQKAWFSYINDVRSSGTVGQQQPSTAAKTSGPYELDEDFRLRAYERLKSRPDIATLPSTGLLVSSHTTSHADA